MQGNLFSGVHKPSKVHKIGIPFQGSKNKIAEKLMDEMLRIKPEAKYFVDVFGGGAAMSFTALQYGFSTHYNELNTAQVNLLKYIIERIKSGERSEYGLFPVE
jgi:site-specific DNA-adenine methylase